MKTINRYFNHWRLLVMALAVGTTVSCDDSWDDHYENSGNKASLTLWEAIESNEDLEEFALLLKKKGYDKYLNTTQSYTVWAPKGKIDTTLVTGELMSAEEVLAQVVENHIARSVIPASSVINDTVMVLNGKYMPLVANAGAPVFNGIGFLAQNIQCKNGILHIMDDQVPYNNNIWTYLRQDSEFSMVADYLYSFNKWEFDPDASTEAGVVNGEKVYSDSVFVLSNELWSQIGYLNRESTDYTMLVPNNNAWEEAVSEYKAYYNYPDDVEEDYGMLYAQRSILNNLIFDMKSQKLLPNYWVSTASTNENPIRFYQPFEGDGLFSAVTETIGCSNGQILKTPTLNLDPFNNLAKMIRVEAEYESSYLVEKRNCSEDDMPVYVFAGNVNLSKGAYMKFTPSSTVLKPMVTYAIPSVLSCSYDIGVVFVPLNLTRNGWVSNIDQKACRVTFELTDNNRDRAERTLIVDNVEIPGDKIDTIWVTKGHTFPYCDYYPNQSDATESKVTLKMTNEVRRNETATHTRDMYIDCIVLKPTKEQVSDEK